MAHTATQPRSGCRCHTDTESTPGEGRPVLRLPRSNTCRVSTECPTLVTHVLAQNWELASKQPRENKPTSGTGDCTQSKQEDPDQDHWYPSSRWLSELPVSACTEPPPLSYKVLARAVSPGSQPGQESALSPALSFLRLLAGWGAKSSVEGVRGWEIKAIPSWHQHGGC